MKNANHQNKDIPIPKDENYHTLFAETLTLTKERQRVSFSLSAILPNETQRIMSLLNCGIGYLATCSMVEQDIKYYEAINSLILSRDAYKTLINADISLSLRLGGEENEKDEQ